MKFVIVFIWFCILLLSANGQSESHKPKTRDTMIIENSGNGPNGGVFATTWQVRITTADSTDATPRPTILWINGAGEVGFDTTNISKYGPHYWLNHGWNGGVLLGNGTHFPNIITIQQPAQNQRPWHLKAILDTIFKYYSVKKGSVHAGGLSQGSYEFQCFLMYVSPQAPNDTCMKMLRSFVDLEGVEGDPADFQNWTTYGQPASFGYWGKHYGGRMFGLEGTGDTRNVWHQTKNMNDSLAGTGYFGWQQASCAGVAPGGHGCWNLMLDPSQTDWRNNPIVGNPYLTTGSPANTVGTYSYSATTGSNVFQWMLRQGDTTLIGGGGAPVTYYFSNAGSDGGACSLAAPCQTIAKANTIGNAGDTIRFNGGNSWSEVLRTRTGVYYGTYGAGKAIITGMTTLSGWSSLGGGIYQTTFSGNANSNLLLMNGVQQPMARFPNTGYLPYQSFSTTTSITSSSLTGTPNYTNGYLALRNNNYTLSYNLITSQSGGTVNYTAGTSQNGSNNFGFFIINDSLALDTLGEWFYSTGTGKMKMYFGGNTPSSFTVQSPTIDTLVSVPSGVSNVTIDNLDIEGANLYGIYIASATNVIIKNCTIKYIGGIGICKNAAVNSSTINSYIQYCNDNGMMMLGSCVNDYAGYDTVRNIGTIPGQGRLLQGNNYKGITQSGLGGITEYCRADTIGYTAIMGYNDSSIHKNTIDYFCFVADDGGGIYHLGYTDTTKVHIIDSNIISNGIGAPAGTALGASYKPANGIYLDNNNFGVVVNSNVVSNCPENGLFVHNTRSCTLTNNTVYNCHYQLQFQGDASAYPIKNNIVKYNIFGIGISTQSVCRMSLFNGISSFYKTCGTIDSNYYAYSSISANPFTIFPSTSLTYQGWKDSTADVRAFNFAAPVDFKSNGTASSISYQLSRNCVNNLNTKFYGSTPIPPYTGIIFLQGSYYVILRGVRPSLH